MRTTWLAIAAVMLGCHAAPPRSPRPVDNDGGDPPKFHADGSLAGPFARMLDAPELKDMGSAEEPVDVTQLGSHAGTVTIALREVRASASSASCVVAIETADGVFVGPAFWCAADRSDESLVTDQVTIAVDGDDAVIKFRTSYQLDTGPPDVQPREIRCNLGAALSCTAPPKIGGYE
jgi:hypothetical protein